MPRAIVPVADRFWDKVDVRGPDDCWPWTGHIHEQGYGLLWRSGPGYHKAHRLSHELNIGPIPADMVVDHRCHNVDSICRGGRTCLHRRCVNPRHLRAVPDPVNIRDGKTGLVNGGREAAKTHCAAAHPYVEDNIYWYGPDKKWRACRKCRVIYKARYRAKIRSR
jgi:hypothetical protein